MSERMPTQEKRLFSIRSFDELIQDLRATELGRAEDVLVLLDEIYEHVETDPQNAGSYVLELIAVLKTVYTFEDYQDVRHVLRLLGIRVSAELQSSDAAFEQDKRQDQIRDAASTVAQKKLETLNNQRRQGIVARLRTLLGLS